MDNEFYALLGRMRNITRWGLMRNTFSENIAEHSYMTAVLAHALALIRRDILGLPSPDPDRCAVAALYHDASEILTGDLPTPIKYYNPDIKAAYKQVERAAGERLLDMLPPELRACYESDVLENDENLLPIVKAAASLSIMSLRAQSIRESFFFDCSSQNPRKSIFSFVMSLSFFSMALVEAYASMQPRLPHSQERPL